MIPKKNIKIGYNCDRMKCTVIFIVFLLLTTCKGQITEKRFVSPESECDTIEIIQYSENEQYPYIKYSEDELCLFFDSIGQLNPDLLYDPDLLTEGITYKIRPEANKQTILNHKLTSSDFKKLKKAAQEQLIDIDFLQKIFPELEFKLEFNGIFNKDIKENKLPFKFYSFDKNTNDFNEFAIAIETVGGELSAYQYPREQHVFFFLGKKKIAKHYIYNHYVTFLKHFKDENNNTVIYYSVTDGSGSDISCMYFFFYKYGNDQLKHVLTEIHRVGDWYCASIIPHYTTAEVVNKRPLQIKFVYENALCVFDPKFDGKEIREFIKDTAVVTYRIDAKSGKYIPNFPETKQNRNKLLTYFLLENHSLFVNTHYDLLKDVLNSDDTMMRNAVLYYLNDMKNSHEN